MTARTRAAAASLLLLAGGCSLVLGKAPPPAAKGSRLYPTCGVPGEVILGDFVMAFGAGALAFAMVRDEARSAGAVTGLVGLAFAASSVRGLVVQTDCMRAREQHEATMNLEPLGPAGPDAGVRRD